MADFNSAFTGQQIEDALHSVNKYGMITVKGSTNLQVFQCVADGVADDRAVIVSAMAAAVAVMPCEVVFSPGDYGIESGILIDPVQGSRGLTIRGSGATSTRIRFNGTGVLTNWIAFSIKPSVDPTVGVFSNYLHDIKVVDIGFYDDDPVAHEGGSGEESHAVKISYSVNAAIDSCRADSIGDEGFDLNFVSQGRMTNNTTINTPSFGSASAINIQFSQSIVISGNTCHGSTTPGTISTVTGSSGIGLENVDIVLSDDLKHIVIANNVIRDFETAGISANNADDTSVLEYIDITGNTIDNCQFGIDMLGNNPHQFFDIANNIISNTANGINCNTTSANNTDCTMSYNQIDACSNRGILCNGTRLNLSGNTISSCAAEAIFVSSALNVVINGGVIDSCGGTSIATIRSAADGKEVTVDGVQILNSNSTAQVILSCERVRNCRIHQTVPDDFQVYSANEITNNTLNGGCNLDGNAYGSGIISGNRIDANGLDLGATVINLASTNDGCIVSNNYINSFHTGTHRTCINLASGCENCVIAGNITVADTPASGIVDASGGATNVIANNQEL